MERIEEIITNEKNLGKDFIVHVQNKKELEDLIKVLNRNDFEIQITFEEQSLEEWMNKLGEEDNYDTCFRIRNREDDKCVAYNPSIEHWRKFYNDILEINDGELIFNEGNYSLETAKIEAKKLWEEIHYNPDEGYKEYHLELYNLPKDVVEEDIVLKLLNKDF